MPIIFERTSEFKSLENKAMERILAEKHLLEKRFDSLEQALSQNWSPGFTLSQYGFFVESIKNVTPTDLPFTITEARICVNVDHKTVPILTARYVDHYEEPSIN